MRLAVGGGEGTQPLHFTFPFPRREGARGWAAMRLRAERPSRCGGNNPQSWLTPCQLLCQRSLLVYALPCAIQIRNPLELPLPNSPFLKGGGTAQAVAGDCLTKAPPRKACRGIAVFQRQKGRAYAMPQLVKKVSPGLSGPQPLTFDREQ